MQKKATVMSLSLILMALNAVACYAVSPQSRYGGGPDVGGLIGLGFGLIVMIILIAVVIAFIPLIFYCLTLQKNLRLTSGYHQMNPGLVWLMFIPLFNFIWHFIIVSNVTKGTKGKMYQMGRDCGDGGWGIGLSMCILACCCWIPFLNWVTGIGYLVTWIIYWIKVAGFNSVMMSQGSFAQPVGAEPAYERFCMRCGVKNQGNTLYCSECGSKLE
jgi:hypothetical protein